MKRRNIILMILLILLGAAQFYRPDIENPDYETEKDFIAMRPLDSPTAQLVKEACYDCHSFETRKPWYASVAPFSWMIADHVEEGREHLNFSVWGDYGGAKREHKLEECVELLEEGEMPLKGYSMMHPKAKLTEGQRLDLIRLFSGMYL